MTEEKKPENTDGGSTADKPVAKGPEAEVSTTDESKAAGPSISTPHPFEALLDEYPLREPSEDPVWSVRIVKGWMYFLAFNFAWMFLFFILGLFYE
jgi:hypothetical protein